MSQNFKGHRGSITFIKIVEIISGEKAVLACFRINLNRSLAGLGHDSVGVGDAISDIRICAVKGR